VTGSPVTFLTGATGFIGGRVARLLSERGHGLRCLVRNPAAATALAGLGAELIEGDICDASALDRGLAGADAAIHLAAIYDLGVVDAAEMERVNVGGTAAFLAAARHRGTRLRVHISSTAALDPPTSGEADETAPLASPPYPAVYHRTKTGAHRLALEAQAAGDPVAIVCPAFVYGPGDQGPAGQMVRDLVRGRLPGLLRDPAWFSFVYVDDVARGIVAAVERGRPGQTWILSGEHASLNDFAERVARAAGRRPPLLRFPVGVAAVTGGLLDALSRVTGARFTMSREGVTAVARRRWLFGHGEATRELGFAPRGLADGIAATVARPAPD
jgi:nucleoside-diphosphate-sugar epimerase